MIHLEDTDLGLPGISAGVIANDHVNSLMYTSNSSIMDRSNEMQTSIENNRAEIEELEHKIEQLQDEINRLNWEKSNKDDFIEGYLFDFIQSVTSVLKEINQKEFNRTGNGLKSMEDNHFFNNLDYSDVNSSSNEEEIDDDILE